MWENKERGAVTVEASIALVAFVFAITTILTVIDICLAQARIGCAIDATAKEISQYSYLYGLTGANIKKRKLAEKAQPAKDGIDQVKDVADEAVNGIFDIIGGMQNTASAATSGDIGSIKEQVQGIAQSGKKLKDNVASLNGLMEKIEKDPKAFIFSIGSLAGSELLDIATSRLIAAPVSRAMVQKHLCSYEGQSSEDYLRALRVVPDATGSYLNGLDFSDSTLFLYGSDEICIIVKYKIKLITLLPIKKEFSFRQIAITKGWLGGDAIESMRPEQAFNDSLWRLDVQERSKFMIDQVGMELEKDGYYGTVGDTHRYFYNPETNSMYTVATSNLMYEHKDAREIKDAEIKEMLDNALANQAAEWDNRRSVTYKTKDDSSVDHEIPTDPPIEKRLLLVIPSDEGLEDRIQEYLKAYPEHKYGFEIDIQASYGKGAQKVEKEESTKNSDETSSKPQNKSS